MIEATECPHCGADLRGPEIPEEHREMYGGNTHFSRLALVEIPGEYDGGLFYRCPDCRKSFHRWPEGHYLHERAMKYVENPTPEAV